MTNYRPNQQKVGPGPIGTYPGVMWVQYLWGLS